MQVGPAFGNHFSSTFLQGLTAWLDHLCPGLTTSAQQAKVTSPTLQAVGSTGDAALTGSLAAVQKAPQAAECPTVTHFIAKNELPQKEESSGSNASTLHDASKSVSPSRNWWPHAANIPSRDHLHASQSDEATRHVQSAESTGSTSLDESSQSDKTASATELATQPNALPKSSPSQVIQSGPALAGLAGEERKAAVLDRSAESIPVTVSGQPVARGPAIISAPSEQSAATNINALETLKPSLPPPGLLATSLGPSKISSVPSDASSSGSVSTGAKAFAADPIQQAHPAQKQHAPLSEKAMAEMRAESAAFQPTASAAQQVPLPDTHQPLFSPKPTPEASTSDVEPVQDGDDWLDAIRQLSQAPPPVTSSPAAGTHVLDSIHDQPQPAQALGGMPAGPSQEFQFKFKISGDSSPETPKVSAGTRDASSSPPHFPGSHSRRGGSTPSSRGGHALHQRLQQQKPLQLSLRLEHLRLTDGDLGQLADWARAQAERAEIVKLWLFDNSISDAGAFHVGRMLHEGMQEVREHQAQWSCTMDYTHMHLQSAIYRF